MIIFERNKFKMSNRNNKWTIRISVVLEIFLLATIMLNIIFKQWNGLNFLILAIVCITFPFIITSIANKKNIELPSNFQLISIMFIVLTIYFGEFKKFYVRFWWWDLFIHSIFGSYAVLIALKLNQGIITNTKETTKKRFLVFKLMSAFNFSIALGTMWEVFEFVGDYLFKTNMVKGGIEDTATDLIVKIIAAFITSMLCYYHEAKSINSKS